MSSKPNEIAVLLRPPTKSLLFASTPASPASPADLCGSSAATSTNTTRPAFRSASEDVLNDLAEGEDGGAPGLSYILSDNNTPSQLTSPAKSLTVTVPQEQIEPEVCPADSPSDVNRKPTRILDQLYLGSELAALWHSFDSVVNMMQSPPPVYANPQAKILHCPIADTESSDISKWFSNAIEFIGAHTAQGRTVLVHCAQGISRSTTVVLAYMIHLGWTLKDCYAHVLARHSIARPNPAFFQQLMDFELSTHGRISMTKDDYHLHVLHAMVPNIPLARVKETLQKVDGNVGEAYSLLMYTS